MRRLFAAMMLVGASVLWTAGTPALAAFPGANGRIVFDNLFSGSSQIYSVRPDGTGLRQLTNFPEGSWAWQPRVSADGRSIVFLVSTEGENDQVWLMRSDGADQHPLAPEPDWSGGGPGFTPDGERIVYSRCGSYVPAYRTCHIVSVRRDGTGMRTIVGGTWHPVEPVVSPDGSTVAYVSDKGGYDARLWLVDADGTDARTIGPTFGVERLSWAPDGSRIAFTGNFRHGAIHTIAPDGSDREKVVPHAIFPAWSPNGRWLVYRTGSSGDLERARADGTHATSVVSSDAVPEIAFSDWGVAR